MNKNHDSVNSLCQRKTIKFKGGFILTTEIILVCSALPTCELRSWRGYTLGTLSRSAGRHPPRTRRPVSSRRRPEAYRYDPTFDKCLFTRSSELQVKNTAAEALVLMGAKGPTKLGNKRSIMFHSWLRRSRWPCGNSRTNFPLMDIARALDRRARKGGFHREINLVIGCTCGSNTDRLERL
jgi:hypothetical protein